MGGDAKRKTREADGHQQRRGKPRGIRHDRDCHSCKLRGVKCDLNRPRCLPCVQSGLPCGGYPQRIVWTGQAASSKRQKLSHETCEASSPSPTSPRLPTTATTLATTEGAIIQAEDPSNGDLIPNQYSFIKRLTAFYERIQSAEGRTSNGTDGSYLSNEAIRLVSRIWDFTRARIQGYSSTAEEEEDPTSMESVRYHVAALIGLNEAIEMAHPVALFGIATFAFFEVCDGAFGEWQCHLYGARSLLDYHCRSRADLDRLSQDISGLTEIVTHLVWFDTMGAIIRGSTGLIFDDWHRATLNESFFRVVGCPAATFDLFVALANAESDPDPVELCFRAMDQLLQLDLDLTDRGRTASAYRCAAVIAVLARMGDDDRTTTMMMPSRRVALASAVDRACQIIASIPSRSGFYIHLAATAYLAGIHATTVRHCEIVRAYWQHCRAGKFPHYPDGQARCEEKWRAEGLL